MATAKQTEEEPAGGSSSSPDPAGRLDSWKAVASYLGRSDKTVRRWEEREGLPIHRLHHDKRGSVYANKQELDSWWQLRKATIETEDGAPDHPAPQVAEGSPRRQRAPSG